MTDNNADIFKSRRMIKIDTKRPQGKSFDHEEQQSQILLGHKDKLLQERGEWLEDIMELEKQLQKKLCISCDVQENQSQESQAQQINIGYDPACVSQIVNSSFGEEMASFPMMGIDDDDLSFGQAELYLSCQRLILSDTEDRVFHEVTFNPQNYSENFDNDSNLGSKRCRRSKSFKTMKPMKKKIHKLKAKNNRTQRTLKEK